MNLYNCQFIVVRKAKITLVRNCLVCLYEFSAKLKLEISKQIGRVQERQRFEELQSSGRHPVSIYRFHCLQLVGQIGNFRIVLNGFKVLSFWSAHVFWFSGITIPYINEGLLIRIQSTHGLANDINWKQTYLS